MQCLLAGLHQLVELDSPVELFGSHALRLLNMGLPMLLPDRPERAAVARDVLQQLMSLVTDHLSEDHIKDTLECLRTCSLSLEFHAVRGIVLQLLANFVENMGNHLPSNCLDSLLGQLAALRDAQTEQTHMVDSVLTAVVSCFGVERLLEAVPLQLEASLNVAAASPNEFHFPRSWLLPVLREALQRKPEAPRYLKVFSKHLLPLADAVAAHAKVCKQHQTTESATRWLNVERQLWQLLPALVGPAPVLDLNQSFRMPLTRILAERLDSRPDLRSDILFALRRLAGKVKCCDTLSILNFSTFSVHAQSEEEYAVLKPRNFLPRLFNLFRAAEAKSEERLRCLETVRAFLSCADAELLTLYYSKCLENMHSELLSLSNAQAEHALGLVGWQQLCEAVPNCASGAVDRLDADPHVVTATMQRFCGLLDLLVALASQLAVKDAPLHVIEQLLSLAEVWLKTCDGHAGVQKKAYRLVQALVETDALRQHPGRLQQLVGLLCDEMVSAAPAARKPRLRCLLVLVTREQTGEQEVFTSAQLLGILSEALASMQENNSKARESARHLLRAVVDTYQHQAGLSPSACLFTVVQHVTQAALTGSAAADESAVQASFLGVSALLQLAGRRQQAVEEAQEPLISHELVTHLLDCSRLLVARPSRMLVRCGVELLQQTVRRSRVDQLSLAPLLDCLAAVKEEHRHAVRFEVKALIRRVCARFGAGLVAQVTAPRYLVEHWPSLAKGPYQRMLRNSVKTALRHARQRQSALKGNRDGDNNVQDDEHALPAETMEEILRQEAAEESSDSNMEDDKPAVKSKRRQKKENAPCLEEAADEIVDLEDNQALSRLHSVKKTGLKKSASESETAEKVSAFPLGVDGRMLILEEGADEDADSEEVSDMEEGNQKTGSSVSIGSTAVEEPDRGSGMIQYAPGGRGIHRPLATSKRLASRFVAPGSEFSAKRAGGDMKRGAVNPYSYVTLDRTRLNRRNVKARQDALLQFRALTKVCRAASGASAAEVAATGFGRANNIKKRRADSQQQKSGKRKRIH